MLAASTVAGGHRDKFAAAVLTSEWPGLRSRCRTQVREFGKWSRHQLAVLGPKPEPVGDEPRYSDDAGKFVREAAQGLFGGLGFCYPVHEKTGVSERAEDGSQRPAPELLSDLHASFVPGVGQQFGVKVAAALAGQWRSSWVIERDDRPASRP